jgi:Ca2+-binding RTX toxin-like protein
VFAPNATTWLNQLNNSVTGFEGGNDVINGQGGNDVLRGLAGRDLLRGEQGADYLLGGRGNDRLEGGDGNDRLRGDFGDDLLLGGAGADRFEFVADRGHDLGADFIADFERGQDDVVLRLAGGFASLDSNGNGLLDDSDAAVAVSGGSTVVTLAAGAYNPVQFTVAGVADLHSADFLFV